MKRPMAVTLGAGMLCAVSLAYSARVQSQAAPTTGEWRDYAGDKGFTKYSPLDQIDKNNVGATSHRVAAPGVGRRAARAESESHVRQ